MSYIAKESPTHTQLRQKAETSILGGSAPASNGWTIGSASLTLLHKLASDPATASDALKLLHELQVHQVELDLQQEHMNEDRQAIDHLTLRQVELYVYAPVAYFMVSSAGEIAEGNLLGARMIGVQRDDLQGHNIIRLVTPDSRAALLALLETVLSSGLRHSCRVQALDTTKLSWLDVVASASPAGQSCLVAVMEVSSEPWPDLQVLS